MLIMTNITVNMGNNLRKSCSKYESQPRMFATARPHVVLAVRRRKRKKKRKKNLDQKHKVSVRLTGCLNMGSSSI